MRPGRALVAVIVGLAIVLGAPNAQAITLTSPLQAGDLFGVNNPMSGLFHVRNQSRLSLTSLTNVGGVFTNSRGDLWFCHNDASTGLTVETIPIGQTASVAKITAGVHGTPSGASEIRDIALDSNGDLYALFRPLGAGASVMKYTSDGSGGFNTGTLVASTGDSFGDRASGRLDLSADEAFLLTGSYSSQRLYSVQLGAPNAVQAFDPAGSLTAQCAMDPNRPNALLYSHAGGVYQTAFNTSTGAISGPSTLLSTDTGATYYRTDAMTFVKPANLLYFADRVRGNEIRYATEQQLAAAAAGTVFDITSLPLAYVDTDVYAMRDMAVSAPEIKLNSPLAPGDVITIDHPLRRVYQIRDGAQVSAIDFGGSKTVGGVFVSRENSLYIANGPGGWGSVSRIGLGETTGTQVLGPTDILGSSPVRDCVVAPDGTVYVSYADGAGSVVKFTPSAGGYSRADLGAFGVNFGGDNGNGHMALTNSGQYLVIAARTGGNTLGSMNTITGAVQLHSPGLSYALIGEVALDPLTSDYLVFGIGSGGNAHLYGLPFNPATGGFGTTATLLNTDGSLWVDALGFHPMDGSLYMCARDHNMYVASADVLAAAKGGTAFRIRDLPILYDGSGVYVSRDIAIVAPEPATLLLLGGSLVALARRRRRNRKTA